MNYNNYHLTRINASGELEDQEKISLSEYSRFKYGDDNAALKYAQQISALLECSYLEDAVITTSGYGFAPPAAYRVAKHLSYLLQLPLIHIHRSNISDGDYASMDMETRNKNLNHTNLTVQGEVRGKTVLAVDDVKVTGVHEKAVEKALSDAGAVRVMHAYIIDAYDARKNPRIESSLNSAVLQDYQKLADLFASKHFVPNARVVKLLLTATPDDRKLLMGSLNVLQQEWVVEAVIRDKLWATPAYREGARQLRQEYPNVWHSVERNSFTIRTEH